MKCVGFSQKRDLFRRIFRLLLVITLSACVARNEESSILKTPTSEIQWLVEPGSTTSSMTPNTLLPVSKTQVSFSGRAAVDQSSTKEMTSMVTSASVQPNKIEVGNIENPRRAVEIIQAHFVEVADIALNLTPVPFSGDNVFILSEDDEEWRIVFSQGKGDCPTGCISNHYWYFLASRAGEIEKVGEFNREYVSGKGYIEEGISMWGYPY